MSQVKWQVMIDEELLKRLDLRAERLRKTSRPLTQFEWMHSTQEGRTAVSEWRHRPEMRQWNEKQMSDWLRKQYEKHTGIRTKTGRPMLNTYRLAVLEQALSLLEASDNAQNL